MLSHPPMLKVSKKRYHTLFDCSSSPSFQSSTPEGGLLPPPVRRSLSDGSGDSRGELSFRELSDSLPRVSTLFRGRTGRGWD
jgi:hypothetical protein